MESPPLSNPPTRAAPVQLREADGTQQVVMEDSSGDRAVYKAAEVFERLRAESARDAGREKVRSAVGALFHTIQTWCDQHAERLGHCLLTSRGSVFLLLAESKSEDLDGELENAVVNLEIALANGQEYQPLVVHTMMIPGLCGNPSRPFIDEKFCIPFACPVKQQE